MSDISKRAKSTKIRAAGGIVLGIGKNSGKIAIVRRRRYGGEIGLPKGKLKKGEDDAQAAVREVYEETGVRAKIEKLAGTTRYLVGSAPKVVKYYLMKAENGDSQHSSPKDRREVEAVEWLFPVQAIRLLTHHEDRVLINTLFNTDTAG